MDTSSTAELFGTIRSILASPPSSVVFDALCDALSSIEDAPDVREYVGHHLTRWPERVARKLPDAWWDLAMIGQMHWAAPHANALSYYQVMALEFTREVEVLPDPSRSDYSMRRPYTRKELDTSKAVHGLLTGLEHPECPRLRYLRLAHVPLGQHPELLSRLLRAPSLRSLTHLHVRECGLSAAQLEVILESPMAAGLEVLDLGHDPDGVHAATELRRHERLPRLRTLLLPAHMLSESS